MTTLCPPRGITRIDANRTVKDALDTAVRRQRERHRISVTDLVNPMQAYHQRTRPEIQIPLERLQLMWTGTGFHRLFGAAVSSEEYLEQFVERDGVVGHIDIYEDFPVEVKTTSSLPEDITFQRPGYVDQLGMYCYMVSSPEGSVVVYRRKEFGRDPGLRVFKVRFRDLDGIGERMRERRDLLADALARHDLSRLGQCEWWNRGCDYQAVCSCSAAQISGRVVDPSAILVDEDSDFAERLTTALAQWRDDRPTYAITFNDLVFPRRGVLIRTVNRSDDDDDNLFDLQRGGFFNALTEAMRYGEPGAYAGFSVSLESVRGVVRTHRGVPTIIRTTNTNEMIDRDALQYERPYWIDRLALETALRTQQTGRLIVFYPRLAGGDKFMVYDMGFRDSDATLAEARRRIALFEANAQATQFPRCGPDWMSRYCPFRENCACK